MKVPNEADGMRGLTVQFLACRYLFLPPVAERYFLNSPSRNWFARPSMTASESFAVLVR